MRDVSSIPLDLPSPLHSIPSFIHHSILISTSSSMIRLSFYLLLLSFPYTIISQNNKFTIPLPFAKITFGKNPDGTLDVNLDQEVNILGNGVKRNTTFTTGNGTFLIKDDANALVNGSEYGGGGNFGVDKNGLVVDNNLNLGKDKKIEGGLGKESNFLSSLFGAIGGIGQKGRK